MRYTSLIIAFMVLLTTACTGNKTNTNEQPQSTSNTTDNTANPAKGKPIELTKADFLTKIANYQTDPQEWKYLGAKPAIIDYYATWCGPCKTIAPILEELAWEYAEDIYIYKIDVDKEPELAGLFNVQSIPTLLFIPLNGMPQIAQGALPKASFQQAIDSYLLPNKKKE